jgi:hypothetical protein
MSEKLDAMSDSEAARRLAKAVLEGSVGHTFAGQRGAVRFCRRCQAEPCAGEGEEVRHAAGCPVPVAEAVLAGKPSGYHRELAVSDRPESAARLTAPEAAGIAEYLIAGARDEDWTRGTMSGSVHEIHVNARIVGDVTGVLIVQAFTRGRWTEIDEIVLDGDDDISDVNGAAGRMAATFRQVVAAEPGSAS